MFKQLSFFEDGTQKVGVASHLRQAAAVAVSACAISCWVTVTHAADAGAADDGTLQAIVVTATKRESNLQDTAISITALTGDTLQERGMSNLQDIISQTPGVSFRSNGGPGTTELQMRGMQSGGGQMPTVGFYLDEVPVTPAAQSNNGKVVIDPNLFDLNRVEVLRGPQGTLYGSGSMGGTVRLITNQPDMHKVVANVQAIGSQMSGGGFSRAFNGAVSVPLVEDKLALRVVLSDARDAGWIDRVVSNPFPLPTNPELGCGLFGCVRGNVAAAPEVIRHKNSNFTHTTGARATLLFQPTDRLSITPMFMYQNARAGGPSTYDSDPGTLVHYQPLDQEEAVKDKFTLYSGTVKYHFDAVDVTSVTSKWTRDQTTYQDDAEIMQVFFGTPAFTLAQGGLGQQPAFELDKVSQFSQELRVSSNWTGPFKALLGVFYSDYDSLLSFDASLPGAPAILGQGTISFQDQPTKIKQQAIFTEMSYKITDRLEATAGLRRYKYDSDLAVSAYGVALGNDINTAIKSFEKTSNTGYNPKFNLAFKASDNDLLYVTASKGFRPGGANGPVPLTGQANCVDSLAALGLTAAPGSYDPDGVWSYEIGNKLEMMDHRVVLNVAAYYQKWTGIQQQIHLACGWVYTANQGEADIKGAELELTARITPAWTVSVHGAYTDAALNADVPEAGGIKGEQLQNIPKYTGGAAVEYSVPLNAKYKLVSRLSSDYTGSRRDVFGPLSSYNLMDFRVGVSGDTWTAHLFAKNLTNESVNLSTATPLTASIPLYSRYVSNQPAMFGLDVSFRY